MFAEFNLLLERAKLAHEAWVASGCMSHNASFGDCDALAEKIINQYREAMLKMRGLVTDSLTTYDLHAMSYGIVLLWLVSCHVGFVLSA